MLITGITPARFDAVVRYVSHNFYRDNLRAEFTTILQSGTEYNTVKRFRARVVPLSSGAQDELCNLKGFAQRSAPGARCSASGRRLKAACWHAYRDVLVKVFMEAPNARVKTAMADYNGRESFYREFPATGYHNIGSRMEPVTMPELCDCDHWQCGAYDLVIGA